MADHEIRRLFPLRTLEAALTDYDRATAAMRVGWPRRVERLAVSLHLWRYLQTRGVVTGFHPEVIPGYLQGDPTDRSARPKSQAQIHLVGPVEIDAAIARKESRQ